MKLVKKILSSLLLLCCSSAAFSYTFFSGYAGGKLNYKAENEDFDPDLTLQGFFAGQFNFTENSWGRMEFSVSTNDMLNFSIFEQSANTMNADFQFDELSWVSKANLNNNLNYFSVYMGTYDPVGSDIFLQRYFGIDSIKSKISESWLGMSGSIIYPHFGAGVSDVLHFAAAPIAVGGYAYVNKDDNFVLNFDGRFASVLRYFTVDFAAGIGLPVSNKYTGEDVIVVIDTLNIHTGLTMLLGNNYTNGLFIQAGFKSGIDKSRTPAFKVLAKDIYLIAEPRFVYQDSHINLTAYCLPVSTIENLLNVDDPLGIDINIYTDTLAIKNKTFTFGWHTSLSFPIYNSNFGSYESFFSAGFKTIFSSTDNINVNLSPYISTNILSGTIHAQGKLNFMSFAKQEWYNAFSVDIGYKCKI